MVKHATKYVAASGALGFSGQGWPWEYLLKLIGLLNPNSFDYVVIKTLKRKKTKGNLKWWNPFQCIRLIPGGVVNAIGLSSPGIEWWCQKIGPHIQQTNLIVSIAGTPEELSEMAIMLNNFAIKGIEINGSCPNVKDQDEDETIRACQMVRKATNLPIILKISPRHNIEKIIPQVENIASAFSINSVPWEMAFPNKKNPLGRFGRSGVSGKAAQPVTWEFARKISEMTSVDVIWPSVWDYEDIEKLRKMGAKFISFGSIFLRYPWRPTLFVRRDKKEQRAH